MIGGGGASRVQGFRRYWASTTVSAFGTSITAVALPILVVRGLDADPVSVGIVNAAQFIPYAVLGIAAGVFVDRWRRRPTLVVASLGRAASIAAIAVLWAVGALTIELLVALLLIFGSFSVFGFAASQSLLPRIVPRDRLLSANARLDQGEAAAQTAGPTLGGLLVAWLGGPIVLVLDAVTFLVEAASIQSIRIDESRAPRQRRRFLPEALDGLRATYRHPMLAPLALSTHVWFVANAAGLTVLAILALRTLDLGPVAWGLLLAVAGTSALVGASVSERVGTRLGEGTAVVAARSIYPAAWAAVAVSPSMPVEAATALLFIALGLHGFAGGIENASEMSLRQKVTPDALLGRVNATMRSANRTAGAIGAILGGVAATLLGVQGAVMAVVVVFAAAVLIAALSPVRGARP